MDKGIKETEGKIDYSEFNFELLDLAAKRFNANKHKYPKGNMKKPIDVYSLKESLFRHARKLIQPIHNDTESELDHLAAIVCNASMILDQKDISPTDRLIDAVSKSGNIFYRGEANYDASIGNTSTAYHSVVEEEYKATFPNFSRDENGVGKFTFEAYKDSDKMVDAMEEENPFNHKMIKDRLEELKEKKYTPFKEQSITEMLNPNKTEEEKMADFISIVEDTMENMDWLSKEVARQDMLTVQQAERMAAFSKPTPDKTEDERRKAVKDFEDEFFNSTGKVEAKFFDARDLEYLNNYRRRNNVSWWFITDEDGKEYIAWSFKHMSNEVSYKPTPCQAHALESDKEEDKIDELAKNWRPSIDIFLNQQEEKECQFVYKPIVEELISEYVSKMGYKESDVYAPIYGDMRVDVDSGDLFNPKLFYTNRKREIFYEIVGDKIQISQLNQAADELYKEFLYEMFRLFNIVKSEYNPDKFTTQTLIQENEELKQKVKKLKEMNKRQEETIESLTKKN